jgi:hypothetical protein
MKWFDQWLYKKTRDMWDNKHLYENQIKERNYINMSTMGAVQIDRGCAEGEDRITFELTSAIGGRILNVRRYDNRKDQHDATTYVIPSGEDVGSRVSKIINLELIK